MRAARCVIAVGLTWTCCAGLASAAGAQVAAITHGPAVGEVTAGTAVVWGRCAAAGTLHVQLAGSGRTVAVEVEAGRDYTGRALLTDLTPDTAYSYRVWCSAGSANAEGTADSRAGTFRSAPAPVDPRPLRLAWGGDVGGQNVCRDTQQGYPVFAVMAAQRPDLFVALGDMIYGDEQCQPTGRYGNAQISGPAAARDRAGYWAHWRYNRADAHLQALLAAVPMAAIWDDHEIRNDAGPHDDTLVFAPNTHLLPAALGAFLDYQPLLPPAAEPMRLYRSLRWGKHLELFVLDTRQYRAPKSAADDAATPKSMLGSAQRAWLEGALATSDATWKVLVASVPLSIPTGMLARDGFASGDSSGGFEREAAALFAYLHALGVRNHLWITTDVHFATAFLSRPLADDPSWVSREFITGPLNAGVFPRRTLDPTFRPERLFFYGPETPEAITSFEAAQTWFNFGQLDVQADGRLDVSVINGRGQTVYHLSLAPESEK